MALLLTQREQRRCACNWHLCFAEIVNEITLHPRPASRSFAGDVETDHPHVSAHRRPEGESDRRGRCHALWSCEPLMYRSLLSRWGMTTTITVQGTHIAWFDAERATVQISAAFDGPKRDDVFERATKTAADVTAAITPLHDADAGPVTWWSSDRVNVWSDRPWNNDGKRLPARLPRRHRRPGEVQRLRGARPPRRAARRDGRRQRRRHRLGSHRRAPHRRHRRRAPTRRRRRRAEGGDLRGGRGRRHPVGDRGRRPRHARRRHGWRASGRHRTSAWRSRRRRWMPVAAPR